MNKLSKEHVVQFLIPRVREIIEKAERSGCRGLDLVRDFTAVPVHYMQGTPENLWELGFVPKQGDFDGCKFSSTEVFLYNPESHQIRGPNDCVFSNGQWERYPD